MNSTSFFKIFIFLIVVIGISYWLYDGPKKSLEYYIVWAKDVDTSETKPIFEIYYIWDGKRNPDPSLLVLKKSSGWKVINFRDFISRIKKQDSEIKVAGRDFIESAPAFSIKYINARRYDAVQRTRFEEIIFLTGFDLAYNSEHEILNLIYEQTQDYDNGKLTQESSLAEAEPSEIIPMK